MVIMLLLLGAKNQLDREISKRQLLRMAPVAIVYLGDLCELAPESTKPKLKYLSNEVKIVLTSGELTIVLHETKAYLNSRSLVPRVSRRQSN